MKIHHIGHPIITTITNKMNLLQVDHHLLIFHRETSKIYNITNSSICDIRNIIFDNNRVIILTLAKLYYLYFDMEHNDFEIMDMTSDIALEIDMDNIKFISGENTKYCYKDTLDCGFYIITQNNEIYHVAMCNHNYGWISRKHYAYSGNTGVNILMAASSDFGIIYKYEDKYCVAAMSDYGITTVYTIDKLPKQFITRVPYCVTATIDTFSPVTDNQQVTCDDKETVDHKVITNINSYQRILLNKSKEVVCENTIHNVPTHIGYSYYHTENLLQYVNRRLNVTWTPGDHHLFGKYVDKYVATVLLCYKKCNYTKYLPKVVLLYIFQFIL